MSEILKNFKKRFNVELAKIKNIAMVGSVILLTLNLALTAYPYIAWRNIHPYVGITALFVVILFIIWILAHLYMNILEMYKEQKLAENVIYNPYAVSHFTPFQEVTWMYYNVIVLDALLSIVKEHDEKEKLQIALDKIKNWFNLGYIPKDDFPEHLKKYYYSKKEERIG